MKIDLCIICFVGKENKNEEFSFNVGDKASIQRVSAEEAAGAAEEAAEAQEKTLNESQRHHRPQNTGGRICRL